MYLSEQNDTANWGVGGGISRAGQRAVTERNNSQQREIMHTEAWHNNCEGKQKHKEFRHKTAPCRTRGRPTANKTLHCCLPHRACLVLLKS